MHILCGLRQSIFSKPISAVISLTKLLSAEVNLIGLYIRGRISRISGHSSCNHHFWWALWTTAYKEWWVWWPLKLLCSVAQGPRPCCYHLIEDVNLEDTIQASKYIQLKTPILLNPEDHVLSVYGGEHCKSGNIHACNFCFSAEILIYTKANENLKY